MNKELKREAVCSKHLQQFREIIECYDCTIYPQENINEQIKLATQAERERIIDELSKDSNDDMTFSDRVYEILGVKNDSKPETLNKQDDE